MSDEADDEVEPLEGGYWEQRGRIRVWVWGERPVDLDDLDDVAHLRHGTRPRCGQPRGYYDHYGDGEPACEACLAAHAAEARKRAHRRNGPPRTPQPCGTPAAYRRHLRNKEFACQACLDALAAKQRERAQARRARE